jgi:hypothetical protein
MPAPLRWVGHVHRQKRLGTESSRCRGIACVAFIEEADLCVTGAPSVRWTKQASAADQPIVAAIAGNPVNGSPGSQAIRARVAGRSQNAGSIFRPAGRQTSLVKQEIWALLLTHYAIRHVMKDAADTIGTDPTTCHSYAATARSAARFPIRRAFPLTDSPTHSTKPSTRSSHNASAHGDNEHAPAWSRDTARTVTASNEQPTESNSTPTRRRSTSSRCRA